MVFQYSGTSISVSDLEALSIISKFLLTILSPFILNLFVISFLSSFNASSVDNFPYKASAKNETYMTVLVLLAIPTSFATYPASIIKNLACLLAISLSKWEGKCFSNPSISLSGVFNKNVP
jgi:hypothetical protein